MKNSNFLVSRASDAEQKTKAAAEPPLDCRVGHGVTKGEDQLIHGRTDIDTQLTKVSMSGGTPRITQERGSFVVNAKSQPGDVRMTRFTQKMATGHCALIAGMKPMNTRRVSNAPHKPRSEAESA